MDSQLYVGAYPSFDSDIRIFLVNGPYVRETYDVEFIYGGHDLRYSFIPERQIWIDDSIERSERPLTILHEITERNLMSMQGLSYEDAHEKASIVEKHFRESSDGLIEAIQQELAKTNG